MRLTGFGGAGWQEEQAEPEPEVPEEFMFDADLTVCPPPPCHGWLVRMGGTGGDVMAGSAGWHGALVGVNDWW